MYNTDEFRPRKLYRDRQRGMIAGVFSGIAEYLNLPLGFTRIVGFFAIVLLPFGLIAYIIAALVLQPMPNNAYAEPVDERFVRSIRRSPEETFSKVRYRFKNIDSRLQKLERYVTSGRFDLDREFDELEKS